jgi:hypothetical protein
MSEAETRTLTAEMKRCDAILEKAWRSFTRDKKTGFCSTSKFTPDGTPVTWDNPFEQLARREEEAMREATVEVIDAAQEILDLEKIPQPLAERIHASVFEEFRGFEAEFLQWLFAAGPNVLEVVRRLFAYAKIRNPDLLWKMGFRDIGPLLKETHASAALRCKALFGDIPAGWKKDPESCRRMKAAAMGNHNRQGGKRARLPLNNNHKPKR